MHTFYRGRLSHYAFVLLVLCAVMATIDYFDPARRKVRKLFNPGMDSAQLLDVASRFTPADRKAIPRLLHTIEHDNSRRHVRGTYQESLTYVNRTYAMEAMARVCPSHPRYQVLLTEMLRDADVEKRCMAALHLSSHLDRGSLSRDLVSMLHGGSSHERTCGAVALARMGELASFSVPELTSMLANDPEPSVRYWGGRAAECIAPQNIRVYAALIRSLSDQAERVRVWALTAVRAMERQEALPC